ncbi:MAG TPA: diphosphate--fructose-6-phosphate 1-phosphotransferase, partial [Chloroflexota bacterium]|nr:diphosphate--fructose-6-phosphate 1-phosphotransferase [Chloroflexota bacterium]
GDVVALDGLGPADWAALARTPAAALGSCRHRLEGDDAGRVLETLARNGVRWFCYIGGNDSMDTAARLAQAAAAAGYPLAVWGIPKTIDNDLPETDHCPGYGSAARYWAVSTQEATLDLAAMRTYDRVLILETMGRNAGWLTAACALYKADERDGPHVLLTPERVFEPDAFLAQVEGALRRIGYCVVATAETIRDASGEYVALGRGGIDRFGHPIVTAVGETLAQLVSQRLGVKARVNTPGTFQRTSVLHVSPVDFQEARRAGQEAARRLARGESGGMVTLTRTDLGEYRCEYGVVALREVANRERRLPEAYLAPDAAGVTTAFLDYARPLLGPAPLPLFRLA